MSYNKSFLFFITLLVYGCVGDDFIDDFVQPELRINNQIDNLQNGTEYQFEATYFNNVGIPEAAQITWSSTNDNVITISASGLAQGVNSGSAIISATVNGESEVVESFEVSVTEAETIETSDLISGAIQTTSSYVLEGDFTVESNGQDGILIDFDDNYRASSTLPGLYLYLSNNPNSINGALEVGMVEVYSGAHSYEVSDVNTSQYGYLLYFCKPFNVKVGDGKL